jgi:Arc/MetJ family transcription regulator
LHQFKYNSCIKLMEDFMRTTLDIDAELIEKVVKTTGAGSKKKAIEIAMKEFLRAKRRKELSDLIGNYEEYEVTLKDLKKMRKDS